MMKRSKKILALLLVCLFCIPSPFIVKAEETDGTPAASELSKGVILDEDSNPVGAMTPHILTTGSETDFSKVRSYGIGISPASGGTASDAYYVMQISMPEDGRLYLYSAVLDMPDEAKAYWELYSDPACTRKVSLSNTTGWSQDVLQKGTYYMTITVENADANYERNYAFIARLMMAPGGNKTIKNKTWVTSVTQNSITPIYYTIHVPKTSKIKVEVDSNANTYVTLCDSKKSPLSAETYSHGNGDSVYFAVSKGTYCLKVKTGSDLFRIRASVSGVKDGTGSSRAKAKAISVNGAAANGYVKLSDKTSKSHWIKCTNKKVQRITLYLTADISEGELVAEVFSPTGQSMGTKTITSSQKKDSVELITSGDGFSGKTFNKGTFYIKITKGTKKTSGIFSVQVKNK